MLAYLRQGPGDGVGAVFNLSAGTLEARVRGLVLAEEAPSQAAGLIERTLTLGPNGFAFLDLDGGGEEPRVVYKG